MAKTKEIYVILFFLAITSISFCQDQLLKNFLTVDHGLSHNEVTSIVQDNDGFIWIGTRGGLNRYDGYEFKVFNQIPGDPNSLVNPSVERLFIDSNGNLWIGTKSGGVSKYDPITGIFKNIVSDYKHPTEILSDNRILSFYEDQNGKIWMGTGSGGLVVYDETSNTSEHYLGTALINSITETADGNIWVGTNEPFNILYEFDNKLKIFIERRKGACQELKYDERSNSIWLVGGNNSGLVKINTLNYKEEEYRIEESSPAENTIHTYESLLIDSKHRIWVGTWGTGFYIFHPETEDFERFSVYPDNRQSLNKDYDAILDIFEDRDKNLWLGTNGGGVCVLTPKLQFKSVGYHPEPNKGLINTRIMSVAEDHSGNLWMGSIGSGLFWSPDKKNFSPVENPLIDKTRFFTIKYLYPDNDNKVWVGINGSTYEIEFQNDQPKMISAFEKYGNDVFRYTAVSFLDSDDIFWYGTLQMGLFVLDKENNYKLLKRILKNDEASGDIKSDRISVLLKDSKDRIWVGTYNGLHIVDIKDTTVHVAENFFNIEGNFTGNIITCLDEDQKGNIWLGTPNGLNKLYETAKNKFKVEYYTIQNGLASNFIKGISHDLNGNIWFSTNLGISKLITKNNENRVVNFDESDGVRGKNFTEASVFKNSKGEIFFGGTHGITWFNPEEIVENPDAVKPVFTGLSVLNQPVEAGAGTGNRPILLKTITHSREVKLSYRQNNFEIEFSALDFKSMGRNQYQYKLENHDNSWIYIGQRRFVNFNNLKPGDYKLMVNSSNSHNVWNEEPAELAIIITPPIWQTWYALLVYILIVVAIVTVIRWNAIKQVRLADNLKMEKMQHEQDQRINELKLRFFTNISHEFRTPLTLILAPLKEIIGKKDKFNLTEEFYQKLGIIQKNTIRLLKLVNQLLDFRRIESGKVKLNASRADLADFVAEVCLPYYELAQINNIEFSMKSSLNKKMLWFDRDKLEIILNNLISNAFKYTSEKGKIEVALYEEEDEVLITVSDNGSGILPTEIKHIFERFYRVGNTENYGSSGLGLALAKRFVELHRGSISVTSEPNQHTEFVVALPKGKDHLKPEEIVETGKGLKREPVLSGVLSGLTNQAAASDDRILVVEDNAEVNKYLVDLLQPFYQVESADNGLSGYEKAVETNPCLIISDVMMPEVDGFELCGKIRNNEKTATIPFIFLTARSDEQYRLLGTQLGADDFISKPFDPNLLLEKVKNILKSRKQLQKQFSKSVRLEPSNIEITPGDEIFIEKAILVIENNLGNDNLSSEMLARELGLSISSLYRKLKELTGSSTAEFIRSIKIKRAAQLLADKERTVTEIAYAVGFNDVKHFRSVFQKHFGCAPTEYREKI